MEAELVIQPTPTEIHAGTVADQILAQAERAVISSAEAATKGAEFVKYIRNRKDTIDAERLKITKPFRDGIEAINNRFRPIVSKLEQAQKLISDKMLAYQNTEARRIREEHEAKLRAAREEAERKRKEEEKFDRETDELVAEMRGAPMPVITAPPKKAPAVKSASATFTTRTEWRYEIEDFAKIPDEYKQLCEKMVKAAIQSGKREIPGLKIFSEEVAVVR